MAKHPSKTLRWKWQSLKNWFYDKWMYWHGYKPYQFDVYKNRYTYIKQTELDEFVREAEEEEPEYELVGYRKDPQLIKPWWRTDTQQENVDLKQGQINALEALRKGRDDARIIRRPLSGS